MTIAQRILSAALMGSMLAGCGGTSWQKNPVGDLGEIRELNEDQAKREQQTQANNSEQTFKQMEENQARLQAELDKTVKERDAAIAKANEAEARAAQAPKVEYQTVIKEVPVQVESATINSDYFIITADDIMTFVEGQKGTANIRARTLVPGAKIELVASGLPAGATLTKSSDAQQPDLYTLSWTPAMYTIPVGNSVGILDLKAKLSIKILSAGDKDVKLLQGLVRDREIVLHVQRDSRAPSDLKVEGLPSQVSEGTQTAFSVTVTVPGIDEKTPKKPTLVITADNFRNVPGTKYAEQSAAPFVIADMKKRDAEYVGNSRWKFSLVLDTKNIPVPFERGADGQTVLKDSAVTHFNMILAVVSPFNSSSPSLTQQLVVSRGLPQQSQAQAVAALEAPRFDLSALNATALELTPGEKAKLLFSVSTLDKTGEVKVEVPNISTLPGSPAIVCAVSKSGAFAQDCLLEWNVPCDAKELAQTISLSAYAVKDGRNSVATKQELKTVKSAKAAAASCTQQEKK